MKYELVDPEDIQPGDEFLEYDNNSGFVWHLVLQAMLTKPPIGSNRPFRRMKKDDKPIKVRANKSAADSPQ